MTLREVADVVGGELVGDGATVVTAPATVDSRQVPAGGLFVAVVGERVDGHDFAEAAVVAGAAAVLSSRPLPQPGVVVADPVAALGLLARHVLDRLQRVRTVALTGSQGKTSTKDLLASVLTSLVPGDGRTVATHGSFNNELGLPLTVLRADDRTESLVLEMGARHVGDLTASCRVAPPDVSLVLNVGKAHLGEFGSREAIAAAKGEIVDALAPDGTAVLNADDARVAAMASRTDASVRTFGSGPDADVRFTDVAVDELGRASFTLSAGEERAHVALRLIGEHHVANAAAAATVALTLGFGLPEVAEALAAATAASRGRMEVAERGDGVTVIDDAYNANPDSVEAALRALAAVGRGRPGTPTVAVLGEMRELGGAADEEHETVGRLAVRLGIHRLLVVGEPARPIHLGATMEASGDNHAAAYVEDPDAALAWLRRELVPGDVVLFKASNAARLGDLAQAVLAEPADAGGARR